MVTIVCDTNNATFYKNGVALDTISAAAADPTSLVYTIGANTADTENFNGKIDELGIWNRALSHTEITDLYNGGVGLTMPPPSSSVEVGTGTIGTRFIDKDYPYEEGLTAGTTKQTGSPILEEQ